MITKNFTDHFQKFEMVPPYDPFDTLKTLLRYSKNEELRTEGVRYFDTLKRNPFFNSSRFPGQKILQDILYPPPPKKKRDPEAMGESSEESSSIEEIGVHSSDEDEDHQTGGKAQENFNTEDKPTLVQDWLFSESLPMIESSNLIKGFLESSKDCEILFKFILSPFKTIISEKGKRKFLKATAKLPISLRKTVVPVAPAFIYLPEKHNPYYLRAQKMLLMVLLRPNYKQIKAYAPAHVDVFYKVLDEEVLSNDKTRADMHHVLKLIQFFLITEPGHSLKNVLKYGVLFDLLAHLHLSAAKETLLAFLSPGDNFLKLQAKDRELMNDYLKAIAFHNTFLGLLANYNLKDIAIEKLKAAKDEKVKNLVKEAEKRMKAKTGEPKGLFNSFLSHFHSLFNKTIIGKVFKQPEEIYTKILNIDRLPISLKMHKIASSSLLELVPNKQFLKRAGTFLNMETELDTFDVQLEDIKRSLGKKEIEFLTPKVGHADISMLRLTATEEEDEDLEHYLAGDLNEHPQRMFRPIQNWKACKLFRGAARTVMSLNLLLNRPQKLSKVKHGKKRLEFAVYPEHMNCTHSDLSIIRLDLKKYFEKCMKQESTAVILAEIYLSAVQSCYMMQTQADLAMMIRLNADTSFTGANFCILLESDLLLNEFLKGFLVKIKFHLENKILFQSAYLAGKAIIMILSNLYLVLIKANFD